MTRQSVKDYFHNMSFTSAAEKPTLLLRNRDFALAVGARATSFIGDEAAVVALTLALAPHGPWAVALLMLAGFAPLIVMAPITGVLVDRYDSRRLLVCTGSAQAVICLALAFTTSLPTTIGLVALLGAGQSIVSSTWSALVPGIVGKQNMARAVGLSQAFTNSAMVIAPAVGGVLVGIGGAKLALLLDVGTFAVLVVAGASVRHRRQVTRAAGEPTRWKEGARVIRADRVLAMLIGMLFTFALLGAMVNVVGVFLIRYTLHAGPGWYGAESAVFGCAMVLGSLCMSRISGEHRLIQSTMLSMMMLAVSMIGYASAPGILWLFFPAVVGGLGNALLNASVNTVVALRIPEEVRGRVAATLGGVMSGAMAGAILLGGVAANLLTPREVFLLAGIVGLAVPLTLGPRLLRHHTHELSLVDLAA